MIYFTADTHFYHDRVIKFSHRPFENLIEMHERLIKNWNDTVKHKDTIYIIGDFCFGNIHEIKKIRSILNGKIILIMGNHDRRNRIERVKHIFTEVCDYKEINYYKKRFILFHYPIMEWSGYFRKSIHLYGHVHNSDSSKLVDKIYKNNGIKNAFNVGVDVNNFKPVSIEEIISKST